MRNELSTIGLDDGLRGAATARSSATHTYAFEADGVGGLRLAGTPALLVITADAAGDGIGVAPGNPAITVGTPSVPVAHTIGTLDTPGDQDYFQVTLAAGQTYQIGMYSYAGGPSLVPLGDPYIEVLTADGTTEGHEVVSADGGATTIPNNVNSGLDVLLTFEPTVSGTYYINARAFGNAGGPNGDEVGDYELFVNDVTSDPTVYRPYYSPDSPLYSIDWGTHVNRVNDTVRNPDGDEGPRDTGNPPGTIPAGNPNQVAGKNVITIYFAREGDTFVSEDPLNPGLPPVLVSVGTQDWEKATVFTALGEFSKVADIVYVEVDTREEADFIFTTYSGTPGPGISLLGSMSPPDYYDEGLAQFNSGDYRWTESNLQQGGFSYVTLIHEFGHGHGLAHPHDNGGYSGEMRGVEGVIDGPAGEVPDPTGVWPNYTLGDFNLNQAVFTMMSYMDGWQDSPYGNAPTDVGYGYLGGLMAFDIAAIQDKYGVNEDWATGDDTYTLKDVNAAGTYFSSIWDAGGTDRIVYDGTRDAVIDLRAATLRYETGGGGFVSYAAGIFGGFTIANQALIENARGGGGNDTLVGNAAGNLLEGGDGDDLLSPGAGADTANGGPGDDGIYFGAELDGSDNADGGGGTNDQLGLQGDYGSRFTLAAGHLVGIEALVLLSGNDTRFGDTAGNRYDYNLETVDANVGANQQLVVSFNGLLAGEDVTFDGSAETNGSFLTYGGLGNDDLTGGQSDDGFYFGVTRWNAGDSVDGQGGTNDQLGLQGDFTGPNALTFGGQQISSIDAIVLLSAADTRFGGGGAGFGYDLTMNDGNVALGTRLYIIGNTLAAGETLTFDGSAETNGRFVVFSGAGDDTIVGGARSDQLHGGAGSDALSGGAGSDVFGYVDPAHSTGAAPDSILDFAARDLIDLTAIDANSVAGANEAFAFIGSAAFTNVPRALRAVDAGGGVWRVEGDVNGDSTADLVILVTSDHPLTGADFAL